MSLLKCAECGGMVSSKATACPHCGCPIEINNGTICAINGTEHDLARILELSKQGHVGPPRGEAWQFVINNKIMSEEVDDDFWLFNELWEVICQTGKVPAEFNSGDLEKDILATAGIDTKAGQPQCPICKSTDLTKLGVASRAISGAVFGRLSVEGRAQFRCNKCGYMW